MNQLSIEDRARVLACLVEGNSIRSTVRIMGQPDSARISTSIAERNNLTVRMQMRRFTRLTNAFSKSLSAHKAALAIHFVHYNFCRIHSTIRVTPAMATGLTDPSSAGQEAQN